MRTSSFILLLVLLLSTKESARKMFEQTNEIKKEKQEIQKQEEAPRPKQKPRKAKLLPQDIMIP